MHHLFEQYGKGLHADENLRTDDERAAFSNFLKCIEGIKSRYGDFSFFAVEQEMSEGVREILGIDEDLKLTGKIDAILKHGKGYLIIDYKTDKKLSGDRDRDHRKQLEIYRKAVSLAHGIPIKSISYAVVYVNLKGNINIGETCHSVEFEKTGGERLMAAFAEDAQMFLEFRKRPGKFLDHVFAKGPGYFGTNTGYLLDALRHEWDREKEKIG
jgi:hypothetical protein